MVRGAQWLKTGGGSWWFKTRRGDPSKTRRGEPVKNQTRGPVEETRAPPADLWSSILDSVSSSRSTPSKQILLWAQPSSGKSHARCRFSSRKMSRRLQRTSHHRTDFAVGYDYADVRDEADEDTLARLSVYNQYTALPCRTLCPPARRLPHTLVMIVLDWTRPWTSSKSLADVLRWVDAWARGDGRANSSLLREGEPRVRREWRPAYSSFAAVPLTYYYYTTSSVSLGPGTLTHNPAGVPIISDLAPGASGMGGMVARQGGEWEERTDGVMQVLRTICLKCANARAQSFPFTHKPNYLAATGSLCPRGGTSWGKITIMREEFEARCGRGLGARHGGGRRRTGCRVLASKRSIVALVPDQGVKPPSLPPLNNPTPEQAFLAKNFDENANEKPDRDPRGAFRDPAGLRARGGGAPSTCGRWTSRCREMEFGIGGGGGSGGGPAVRAAAGAGARRPAGLATTTDDVAAAGCVADTAAGVPSPTSAAGNPTQHEVLQNFFQRLLSSKDRAGAGAAATKAATAERAMARRRMRVVVHDNI
ncbi:hypothetical protein C8J57DRAFT_1454441 [Mycena rebaudengoi]|nr:hypothetical protein C8J57DRAFT_1454441 [Mycena rebaudengoi]